MTTLNDLLPELITTITTMSDPVAAFALRYTNKRNHAVIPFPPASASDLMAAAAYAGKHSVIEWLHSMGCTARNIPDNGTICTQAARGGRFHAVKLLHDMGFTLDHVAANYAAMHNHTNVKFVKYIVSNTGWEIEMDTVLVAAAIGNINLLNWINTEFGMYPDWRVVASYVAASTGKLSALKWLEREYGIILTQDKFIMYVAAYNGHLDIVEWLIAQHGIQPAHALAGAAAGDQIRVIAWISSRFPAVCIDASVAWATPEYDAKSPGHVLNKYK